MKASVIGEHGFIGRHLLTRLASEPCDFAVPTLFHVAGKFAGVPEADLEMLDSNIIFGAEILRRAKEVGVQKFVNAGTIWNTRTLYGACGCVGARACSPACVQP